MTKTSTASRYECSLKTNAGWQSSFHSAGNGKPRSKRCTYCGGAFRIETGLWGVFVWSGENRYPLEAALKTFVSPTAAQKFADVTSNGVVRWLPEGA
jgi:hypothetical protein